MMRAFVLSACLLAAVAKAEPPGVSHIFPAGGQRGTKVDVRVGGFYLHGRAGFEMTGAGVQASPEVKAVENFWIEGPMILKPESQKARRLPEGPRGKRHHRGRCDARRAALALPHFAGHHGHDEIRRRRPAGDHRA